MGDQVARGEEFEKKAEKKLSGWALFSSKYEDAADFFEKAANCFKLAKSWDQAGATYVKLANCHLKLDSKHEAASAFADAGHNYKKTNTRGMYINFAFEDIHALKVLRHCSIALVNKLTEERGQKAVSCLEQAVNLFLENGRLNMSARYYKEIAEIYEQEQNLEQAIAYYEKAADLFLSEDVSTTANQCKQKIAQFSAQLEKYPRAIEIFEDIARQSVNNNLLKYGVRGHLLNAGICQLCKGDVVAINNALEKYQDLDPSFSGTREFKLLSDLAAALDEEDIGKFTDAVKEYDSMTQLDAWRTTLLLRVKESIKAKELEEDDLT
nr:alpha-soluble NSF attachment protein [Ipomoea batatas]